MVEQWHTWVAVTNQPPKAKSDVDYYATPVDALRKNRRKWRIIGYLSKTESLRVDSKPSSEFALHLRLFVQPPSIELEKPYPDAAQKKRYNQLLLESRIQQFN